MKEILYATADTSLKDDLNQLESRVSDLETSKGNPKGGEITFNHLKEDGTPKTFEDFTLDERDSWLYEQMNALHRLYHRVIDERRICAVFEFIWKVIVALSLIYLFTNHAI